MKLLKTTIFFLLIFITSKGVGPKPILNGRREVASFPQLPISKLIPPPKPMLPLNVK
ncbi:hypothetical protein [Pedobacter ginsengisoli]|uniref:hypothetical protein n=1 Tax=Pedobacter ginsengisoli TaxID=363852 RepID=UPI0012FE4FAF|nr:hypothetical protein [Pedobacter ginsengisoli]